ncbi:hypothetical protein [Canibacter zhoujuaniae]|uniref:hypothetical protein n=1 Tax=Canibacter zhoujuaniae TaxID=2708343 RepID=UPI001421F305|nr:hypothetical protein [Canibacter zhoujuaniae]
MLTTALLVLEEAVETELDPNMVTPGPLGFLFIGVLALAVIGLSFSVVGKLRAISYREQVREEIAAELSEQNAKGDAQTGKTDSAS